MENAYTVKVNDYNWGFILNRVLREAVPVEHRAEAVRIEVHDNGTATYEISREHVPAEALAKVFGVSVASITKAPRIVLKAITGDADWQVPTVDYIGEA